MGFLHLRAVFTAKRRWIVFPEPLTAFRSSLLPLFLSFLFVQSSRTDTRNSFQEFLFPGIPRTAVLHRRCLPRGVLTTSRWISRKDALHQGEKCRFYYVCSVERFGMVEGPSIRRRTGKLTSISRWLLALWFSRLREYCFVFEDNRLCIWFVGSSNDQMLAN